MKSLAPIDSRSKPFLAEEAGLSKFQASRRLKQLSFATRVASTQSPISLGAREAPAVASCSPANCELLAQHGSKHERDREDSECLRGRHAQKKGIEIFEEVMIAQRYSESRGVR